MARPKTGQRKVRSVRTAKCLTYLNLTDVVRELEDLADKIEHANALKSSGDRQAAEKIIVKAKNYMANTIFMMVEYALYDYRRINNVIQN